MLEPEAERRTGPRAGGLRRPAVALALAALAFAGCSGSTQGTTSISSSAATLNLTGSCGSGERCTWYYEYWRADAPRSTSVRTPVSGPVPGPIGDVSLPRRITGLSPGTTYRWVACGSVNAGVSYACVGPGGPSKAGSTTADPPRDFETFTTTGPASANGPLPVQWVARVPTGIVTRATVAGGRVFAGGFNNGYEYAFSESAGGQLWSTSLGTSTAHCDPDTTQGVASSPAVLNGTAYLGGGDANWDALDAATGRVVWSFPVGDNSPTGGNFNYSSPLLYGGHAYVGVASFCDNPLVQGKLLRVNLATHQIDTVWKGVPDGHVGGTIWTNPVVDPATNTVYVTTGTRWGSGEPYAEAMVALDATTLALKGAWSPPETTLDGDWGTTPTLFTGAGGRPLVGGTDKDGNFYAMDRANVSAGPVWTTRIAEGGPCPTCGDGSISTAYYDGTRIYVAGGRTTIAGKAVAGSVRALDPATGRILWEVPLSTTVLGALTGQDGMVVVPAIDGLYVLDGATGASLYGNDLGPLYTGATIDDGRLIIGTATGALYSLAFPSGAGQGGAAKPAAAPAAPAARAGSPTSPVRGPAAWGAGR